MNDSKMIGNRIKMLRKEREKTLEEMAVEIQRLFGVKIEKSMISKWERGMVHITLQNAIILAQYFDTSVDFLACITANRTKS